MPSRDKNYFRRQVLTALLQPKLAYTFGYLITFCIPYVIEVTLYTDTRHLFYYLYFSILICFIKHSREIPADNELSWIYIVCVNFQKMVREFAQFTFLNFLCTTKRRGRFVLL